MTMQNNYLICLKNSFLIPCGPGNYCDSDTWAEKAGAILSVGGHLPGVGAGGGSLNTWHRKLGSLCMSVMYRISVHVNVTCVIGNSFKNDSEWRKSDGCRYERKHFVEKKEGITGTMSAWAFRDVRYYDLPDCSCPFRMSFCC